MKRLHQFNITASRPLLALAFVLAPALAAAQAQASAYPRANPQPAYRAADPLAPVPAAVYQSPLTGLAQGVESQSADWRRANDEVGQFKRGHIDLLKLESGAPTPALQPAQPRSQP